MKKKLYRCKLSFDKAELSGMIGLQSIGIQLGRPARTADEKTKMRESFGFFGSSSDSNKYYNDIASAADVMPKPEDFVEAPFRLISATTVGAGTWKATDFSDARILKGSVAKLDGKPVYKNHDMEVDNWVGMIQSVKWSEGFTNSDNTAVPAGIDGVLAIDSKTNPKIARGVLMGAIYSNSVTVEFDWEMSHHFENDNDFLYKVGTEGTDGKMIRRIVKNIYNYHETSLVFLGADPFAKAIDANGNLKNIDTGSISYDKATDAEKAAFLSNNHKITISQKVNGMELNVDAGVLSFAKSNFTKKPDNQQQNKDDMKEIFAFLIAKFGLKEGDVTETNYMSYIQKLDLVKEGEATVVALNAHKAKLFDGVLAIPLMDAEGKEGKLTLTGEGVAMALPENAATSFVMVPKEAYTKLGTDLTEANNKVTSLDAKAKLGENFISMQRAECVRLYKLSQGDNVSDAVIALMNKAEGDELTGLLGQYTKGATAKFTGTCKKCNSTDVSFRSSIGGEDDEQETVSNVVTGPKATSFDDLYKNADQSTMGIRRNN